MYVMHSAKATHLEELGKSYGMKMKLYSKVTSDCLQNIHTKVEKWVKLKSSVGVFTNLVTLKYQI